MNLETINSGLFELLKAPAGLSQLPLALASAAANYPVMLLPGLFVVAWLGTYSREQVSLVYYVLCAAVALGTNYALGSMFPHLRPFMLGLSPNYLGHAAENGFPSDHATVMWVVGFALFLNKKLRGYGWAAVALAALTSWARVFLGVHFPFDILGSIVVAAFTLAGMQQLRPWIERAILALSIRAGIGI